MSRDIDAAGARIFGPLSALLKKPIRVVDSAQAERNDAFTVHLPLAHLSVVSAGGAAFSDVERQLIYEIFDLIRHAEENSVRVSELQDRIGRLERENLDLIVKHRILAENSARDALTGLYNRWFVMDKMEAEINRSLRHGAPLSLMMLDIDHFKRINDTWGHTAGDQVLQSVGKLLRESCRVYDIPGRYGGEEFCILLPETRIDNTSVVANRIRERLEVTGVDVPGASVAVTASIGIAALEGGIDGPLTGSALIDRADRALYSAKQRGRNRVELWDSAAGEPSPAPSTEH
ncbi:MAG TPA: GGDEF domain-containing protein [Thermoanaerobaculia bacterium]|nr:GGDEF domain-containing protein [Thermoanaerobaculia bacterium]